VDRAAETLDLKGGHKMKSTEQASSVDREIAIAASPETVWEFLVDSDKATRWMGQSASLDPRPGGVYRIEVIPGNTAVGEFLELDPPRRLVYSWGWEPGGFDKTTPPASSTIEIELVPDGEGTTLRFSHRGLPNEEAVQSHAHGWDHYLERLVVAARGDDPGIDPWLTGNME
jgi:uncharacterized protein YndB with AHSA1/START domain